METRANYALIGAFTLAVAFAAFLFVYWFSGPSQLGRQETYQIVFTGAVSGLTRGSSVLFNGVKVGEVTHLGISEQDPSKVDVLVRIDSRTPVKTDTRARLETRGFTGVSDVLLVGGTHGAPPLTAQNDQKYPQIQAERSEFQNLLGNVQNLSTKAAELLTKLDKLIDENGPAITATLQNAEKVSKNSRRQLRVDRQLHPRRLRCRAIDEARGGAARQGARGRRKIDRSDRSQADQVDHRQYRRGVGTHQPLRRDGASRV